MWGCGGVGVWGCGGVGVWGCGGVGVWGCGGVGPKCPLFNFPESNIRVVLTSESVDEILCCHHSDETFQQYFHMVLFIINYFTK